MKNNASPAFNSTYARFIVLDAGQHNVAKHPPARLKSRAPRVPFYAILLLPAGIRFAYWHRRW